MHLVSVDHGIVADVLEHLTITARQIAGASDTIVGRHPVLGSVVLVLDGIASVATLLSEIPPQEPDDATPDEIANFRRIAVHLGIIPATR